METFSSILLTAIYAVTLAKAIPLLRLRIGSAGWKRAWFGVVLLAAIVCTRQALLVVDSFLLDGMLRGILRGEVFSYGVRILASLVLLGITVEHAHIFLRQTPFIYPGMPIVVINQAGRVVSWNGAAEDLFGWTLSEVATQELAAFLIPERFRAQHREGLQQAQIGGPSPVLDRPFQTVALHKDGHEIPVEVIVTKSAHGTSVTYVGMIRRL